MNSDVDISEGRPQDDAHYITPQTHDYSMEVEAELKHDGTRFKLAPFNEQFNGQETVP